MLENGPASRFAVHFDVDWDPPEAKLRNRVLLPVLGDHYGRVLEAGELELRFDDGWFTVRYHEHVMPVAPPSLDELLISSPGWPGPTTWPSSPTPSALAPATATDRVSVYERWRDTQVLRAQLARLCAEEPDVAAAIAEAVERVNAEPDALDALLERQNYRLAYWRTASEDLDYRRFFDIATLVGLRVEDDRVFADTHALVLAGWRPACSTACGSTTSTGCATRPATWRGSATRRRQPPSSSRRSSRRTRTCRGLAGRGHHRLRGLNMVGGLFVDPRRNGAHRPVRRTSPARTARSTTSPTSPSARCSTRVLAADVRRLTKLLVDVASTTVVTATTPAASCATR